jgi:dTDP-4-dehydrorhamnose reductase
MTRPRPILITGATGTLGRAFERLCVERGLEMRAASRADLDITDTRAVAAALDRHEPWLVVNAAGYERIDDAEHDPARCYRENALGAANLARRCARTSVALLSFSSDLVFDGGKETPYVESDVPAPLGVYGWTKYEAETAILDHHPRALVVRTGPLFGVEHDFVTEVLRQVAIGGVVRAASDTIMSPTYIPDLVHACLDLAIDGESGLWHLANLASTSWADLARNVARLAGCSPELVEGVSACELTWRARRPVFSALGSSRGTLLPPLGPVLERHCRECRIAPDGGRLDDLAKGTPLASTDAGYGRRRAGTRA